MTLAHPSPTVCSDGYRLNDQEVRMYDATPTDVTTARRYPRFPRLMELLFGLRYGTFQVAICAEGVECPTGYVESAIRAKASDETVASLKRVLDHANERDGFHGEYKDTIEHPSEPGERIMIYQLYIPRG